MKYTRTLCTTLSALGIMLLVTLFSSVGQRLGWCQQQQEFTPDELACIDSGLTPDCEIPPGGVGTWKGDTGGNRSSYMPDRGKAREEQVKKAPSRSRIEVHDN